MSSPDKPSEQETEQGGDFLSRWSRRKVEAKEQENTDQNQPADIDEALQDSDPTDENQLTEEQIADLSDEEILEELGLPDPDAMKAGDDFKVFMKSAVPKHIQNRALRKLWLSNPALANVDMLVDYGEDFTDAATVIPGMKTAYEVGKGIAKQYEEMLEKLKLEEAAAEQETSEAEHPDAEDEKLDSDVMIDESVEIADIEANESVALEPSPAIETVEGEFTEEVPVYVPQRMRFTV